MDVWWRFQLVDVRPECTWSHPQDNQKTSKSKIVVIVVAEAKSIWIVLFTYTCMSHVYIYIYIYQFDTMFYIHSKLKCLASSYTICLSNEQLLLSWEVFAICTSARRSAPCRCVTSWAQCLRVSWCLEVAWLPSKKKLLTLVLVDPIHPNWCFFLSLLFVMSYARHAERKSLVKVNSFPGCSLGGGIHLWLSFPTSSQGPAGPGQAPRGASGSRTLSKKTSGRFQFTSSFHLFIFSSLEKSAVCGCIVTPKKITVPGHRAAKGQKVGPAFVGAIASFAGAGCLAKEMLELHDSQVRRQDWHLCYPQKEDHIEPPHSPSPS